MSTDRWDPCEKGKKLWADGWALVDTSGRTHNLQERSVIAVVHKDYTHTSLFPSSLKKELHTTHHSKYPKKNFFPKLHAIQIAQGLKPIIDDVPGVYICSDGHSHRPLKQFLLELIGPEHSKKIKIKLSLKQLFGKKNPADRAAYNCNKKGNSPTLKMDKHHFHKHLEKKR